MKLVHEGIETIARPTTNVRSRARARVVIESLLGSFCLGFAARDKRASKGALRGSLLLWTRQCE